MDKKRNFVVTIDPRLHAVMKNYCSLNTVRMSHWINSLIIKELTAQGVTNVDDLLQVE